MPASSYAQLYDFPGNVAAAAKAVLVADAVTLIGSDTSADDEAFIFGPRENESMPPNRIEVIATTFVQGGDQQVQSTLNSEWFFAHFTGQIMIRVQTPRAVTLAAAEHAQRVGRIMFLMQPRARSFNTTNLPHYEIIALRMAGLPRAEQDAEQDADITELTFNVELWILPGAFPETIA